jgi:Gpi18-like mannosyltransferase
MGGTYWGLRCLALKRIRESLLSGACFGLAYLTRPEAIAFPVMFIAVILAVPIQKIHVTTSRAFLGCSVSPFAVLATP